ncbi:MAG: hypothetical protein HGA97_13010 [Chlorobiaceae bacterium]|nr:hypothetical protein [Chlorobiaceae bacterium]
MSNAPMESRSIEIIEIDDLHRLAQIPLKKIDDAFNRRPDMRNYEGELLWICLCQGAADHYVNSSSSRGIHDFDLWVFYRRQRGKSFWNRKASTDDFGTSKFGRSSTDIQKYVGSRVDVFLRSVLFSVEEDRIDVISRYFAEPKIDISLALRKKSVIMVYPENCLG